jgi:hypothetical protein
LIAFPVRIPGLLRFATFEAELAPDFLDAVDIEDDTLDGVAVLRLTNASNEPDHAASDGDLDAACVDVSVTSEALADLVADPIIRALIALRALAEVRTPVRAIEILLTLGVAGAPSLALARAELVDDALLAIPVVGEARVAIDGGSPLTLMTSQRPAASTVAVCLIPAGVGTVRGRRKDAELLLRPDHAEGMLRMHVGMEILEMMRMHANRLGMRTTEPIWGVSIDRRRVSWAEAVVSVRGIEALGSLPSSHVSPLFVLARCSRAHGACNAHALRLGRRETAPGSTTMKRRHDVRGVLPRTRALVTAPRL